MRSCFSNLCFRKNEGAQYRDTDMTPEICRQIFDHRLLVHVQDKTINIDNKMRFIRHMIRSGFKRIHLRFSH